MATAPTPTSARQDSYSSERQAFGGVTLVTMHGTLNDTFDGRKLATSIRTRKILVHMNDVSRLASWGMSEWMDFLRVTADCDIYLIECSTYAVSQLALITGLLGHAKLVSFYASYRCSRCNEEMQTRFIVPRDRSIIPDIPKSYQDCPSCGGHAALEEYPAAFFDTIAARPAFDIDDEVLAFMRSHLQYDLSPDLTRFRAYRKVQKGYTYLQITGNIAAMPSDVVARACSGTVVADLQGVVVEPTGITKWHELVQAASPNVTSLQLASCPLEFLETAVTPDDLHGKVKIRSFTVPLQCGVCDTTTPMLVDVAANLEELTLGQIPAGRCSSCRATITPPVSEQLDRVLRALPARDRDVALDTFFAKATQEPSDKLENCLAAPAASKPKSRRSAYLAGAVGLLVLVLVLVVGAGVVWQQLEHRRTEPTPIGLTQQPQVPDQPPPPTFTRPDWITSDVPGSGYCHDMVNRLVCVGVSSYRSSRDDGVGEANDAALDELVNTIGLKISQPFFRDNIEPEFGPARRKALGALQVAVQNRSADAKSQVVYSQTTDAIRATRKQVVAALQASGGAAVPAQRADWYWEEYANDLGKSGTEFLVLVRYDISADSLRALVEKYSTVVPTLDASAMTAFPALAWSRPSFVGGAVVVTVGNGHLAKAGIAARDLITAVDDKHIDDVGALAHKLQDATHDVKLMASRDGKDVTVTVAH